MAQHDYVISNGTGAAVRSDLNGAFGAIVSQNSGATAPATTYAYQWWADTTTNTLKLRNSANSAWIELRQLDGDFTTVSVDNGTAAAPSIYFNASGTDTGIFSSGTDAVDISTAGTRRFGIASAGDITVFGGNVTLNAQGDLRFADSDSSNYVAFQAPATVASNITWTLPATDAAAAGYALVSNAAGVLSWAVFAALATAQTFTAAQRGAITALTDGATITADLALANNYSVTLAGNRTLANPTNITAGQSGCIFITQDGTGSRTLSFGSHWDFPAGTAPTLTTTANAVDLLVYTVRTATSIQAQLIANFS